MRIIGIAAMIIIVARLAAQSPATRTLPLPTTSEPNPSGKAYYEAQNRDFEDKLQRFAAISNQYAELFNRLMNGRGEKWDVRQARELVKLRQEADRAWDKLINSPLYRH